ncbi:MAG: hypothetical protein L0323_10970 [Planctomycetes bacterium]|nr:hypothetical protein [Planctomycetota bacterium]
MVRPGFEVPSFPARKSREASVEKWASSASRWEGWRTRYSGRLGSSPRARRS